MRTRYPGARLWAVLEPRSNTLRRRVLEAELIRSLGLADEVVIAGVFRADAIPEAERLSTARVVEALRKEGRHARELADADAIVAALVPELRAGDVVAILSNGGFGGIYEKLPQRLKAHFEVPASA